jgi:hypothetical protein
MRRLLLPAVVLAAALALPAFALAKGPASASLSGPGLDRALAVTGQGELGQGTPLGTLVDSGGFFAQIYGQQPDPTTKVRPRATLGPRYLVVYVLPGPNNTASRLRQDVYPYAKPVPLTYMKPGQSYWNGRKAHGGWFRGDAALTTMLVKLGLPATG